MVGPEQEGPFWRERLLQEKRSRGGGASRKRSFRTQYVSSLPRQSGTADHALSFVLRTFHSDIPCVAWQLVANASQVEMGWVID
eukprot:4254686-Pleurochrysis_carterae.AAC.1